jgi:hypothetical protein
MQALAAADDATEVPAELHDRAADNWRPLFTIADRVGGKWPSMAREAALTLSGVDMANSLGVQLLTDIQEAFRPGEDGLPTKVLIERLTADPERPWADYRQGKPISPKQLGRMLRAFRIASETVHPGSAPDAKGYRRMRFEEAWAAYVPPQTRDGNSAAAKDEWLERPQSPLSRPLGVPETSKRPNACGTGTSDDFRSVQEASSGRIENDESSYGRSGLDVWTLRKPEGGEGQKLNGGRGPPHPSADLPRVFDGDVAPGAEAEL